MVDKSDVIEINNDSNNIEFKEVAEAGHFLPLEQPKKLADIILNWLD